MRKAPKFFSAGVAPIDGRIYNEGGEELVGGHIYVDAGGWLKKGDIVDAT